MRLCSSIAVSRTPLYPAPLNAVVSGPAAARLEKATGFGCPHLEPEEKAVNAAEERAGDLAVAYVYEKGSGAYLRQHS